MAFNIIIAHIPGKTNYAADFLSQMQTDPSASLSLKLTEKIPVREIQIDTTAKAPGCFIKLGTDRERCFCDLFEKKNIKIFIYVRLKIQISASTVHACIQNICHVEVDHQ